MIVNGQALLEAEPLACMEEEKRRFAGVSFGLSEAGYDLRLKQSIHFYKDPSKEHWIIRALTRIIGSRHLCQWRTAIDGEEIGTGAFVLASAVERFQMPVQLVAVMHDKSTWARKGLSVFNTVAEPAWRGYLTLELVYHGQDDLYLPAGCGIAQALFSRTVNAAEYKGKYSDQPDRPVEAILEGSE